MTRKTAVFAILMFGTLMLVQGTRAQTVQDNIDAKLSKHVGQYDLGACTFVEALIKVSNNFEIPMGIEWVNSAPGRAEYPYSWKSTTVRGVIESIANTLPGYQVHVSNGVVHVFANGLIPDQQNFTTLKIESFSIHQAILELASYKLHTLLAPTRGNQQISIAGKGDSTVDLELNNTTVEEILDALALASYGKIWVVAFSDDSSLTALPPKGMRRTTSLWTDKPVPDSSQPAWSFFRWGDAMPPRRTK